MEFGLESRVLLTPIQLVKNLERIDPNAFVDDDCLQRELVCWRSDQQLGNQPLGVVLISKESKCVACESPLILRKDRPSHVTVYDTIAGNALPQKLH